MFEIENSRKELLDLCNKVIEKSRIIDEDENAHVLIKKMAEQIGIRSEKIYQLCNFNQYNVYFNGKAGVGKSTSISTLFGLINKEELNQGKNIGKLLLLKTGSGRTTVCETRIIPNAPESKICIEAEEEAKFNMILGEFCKMFESKPSSLSDEEARVIKNMAGLPFDSHCIEDLNNLQITECNESEFNLYSYLKNKIGYSNRNRLQYEKGNEQIFESWLKETYENINDGKLSDCPMPRRIDIYVNESEFQLYVPKYVKSIIDTRGLDGGERKDIQTYLSSDDSISFMCDRIEAFGGEEQIISILRQVLIPENKDTKYRVSLLGLDRGSELEDDGEGNYDAGVKNKKRQAIKKLNDNSIEFRNQNIYFCNTVGGIDISKHKIVSYSTDEIHKENNKFTNILNSILANMYISYKEEMYDSIKMLEQLSVGKITESTLQKFFMVINALKCQRTILQAKNSDILKRVRVQINSMFPASLRGAVNHKGEGNKEDLYASIMRCSGEKFIDLCREHKAIVMSKIDEIFSGCSDIEHVCYQTIKNVMDQFYSDYYNKVREYNYNVSRNGLYNDISWSEARSLWGDGLGDYRGRVAEIVIDEIANRGIKSQIETVQPELKFIDKVISFLEVEQQ